MKEKYVEEAFPRYMVFGEHANGMVDVSSTKIDTVATVTPEQAEVIIHDRDLVIDKLVATVQAFYKSNPEAFLEFWYGSPDAKAPA